MTTQWKQGTAWAAAVTVAIMVSTTASLATEVEEEPEAFCPGSQGGYKNSDAWPVDQMFLGAHEYSEAEMRALLDAPTRGDASISLARQLIAAELNVAGGHNASVPADDNTTVAEVIASAHALIGDATLPAKVRGAAGDEWGEIASVLDAFNNGDFTAGCAEEESSAEEEQVLAERSLEE